jgi:hypothetical protein
MNNGFIDKDFYGDFVVVYEYKEDFHKVIEEIPLHPTYKNYDGFKIGQPIKFQYVKECTIHYPHYCDCFKLKTYALLDMSKKPTLLQRFKSLFKRR